MELNRSKRLPNLVWVGVVVVLLLFVLIGFSQCVSTKNTEARLVQEFKAQEKKIELVHNTMFSTLKQKAGVTEAYAEQFDSIYSHIMDKRYSHNDGVLMNWIQEQNPSFDASMYKDLCVSIEVLRKQFLDAQEKIVDICREHNQMLYIWPESMFLSGCSELEYEVISSSYSKEVMTTRRDDDLNLFEK